MKVNKLTIQINKPVAEVFEFTTDPHNTSKWIEFVDHEETSEWPPKERTVYRNTSKKGETFSFTMTKFEKNKGFDMVGEDNNYHCRYTFRDLGNNATELEYYEWMEIGELDGPFTQDILEKLKAVMENPQP